MKSGWPSNDTAWSWRPGLSMNWMCLMGENNETARTVLAMIHSERVFRAEISITSSRSSSMVLMSCRIVLAKITLKMVSTSTCTSFSSYLEGMMLNMLSMLSSHSRPSRWMCKSSYAAMSHEIRPNSDRHDFVSSRATDLFSIVSGFEYVPSLFIVKMNRSMFLTPCSPDSTSCAAHAKSPM